MENIYKGSLIRRRDQELKINCVKETSYGQRDKGGMNKKLKKTLR